MEDIRCQKGGLYSILTVAERSATTWGKVLVLFIALGFNSVCSSESSPHCEGFFSFSSRVSERQKTVVFSFFLPHRPGPSSRRELARESSRVSVSQKTVVFFSSCPSPSNEHAFD